MSTTLFAPLERVVGKYKQDVNRLASPASPAALNSLEGHLGRALPPGLRHFLERHNGAQLLRGALSIRTASAITASSETSPQVVLFADGQGDLWAWSHNGYDGYAFGRWSDGELEPLHSTFAGWLRASIAVAEARVTRERDRVAMRFEADRDDVYQLLAAGVRALRQGDPDPARAYLQSAARHPAGAVGAWQRLGDALAVEDRSAAREVWLRAFHSQRFPRAFPGSPCLDPDVFRSVAGAFSDPEDYEREITRFLDEQVDDVLDDVEGAVVVAATAAVARSAEMRGKRSLARKALADLIGRCRLYAWNEVPWGAVLRLARLEVELGNHDEAEALLRRLRRGGPRELVVRSDLLLGRIAVTREEPWAEQILLDVLASDPDDSDRYGAAILLAERAIRRDRLDDAQTWIDRADGVAKRLGVAPLTARVHMVRGDLARSQNDIGAAQNSYDQASACLLRQDDAELRFRLYLRTGDLALATGQAERAHHHFRLAAEGFAQHELPVREAWALVRLARLSSDGKGVLKAARQRFEHADLAAGIAAVDAVGGDPGASLDWHLHRATAQARARYDAQRSRPPWERSDADRPERRLGAHRVAISACGGAVVERLAAELAACARAMATGRMRAVDAPVLRYVAAVDLLAGHRSFRAAQVLLDHLVQQRVTGPARRALQAAVARSPNAALVDGLLRCIETPMTHPASVVAEAAEVLGLRREASALVALADRTANPMSRKASITALARIGERSAVDAIMPALQDSV
ncbi:MAG: tetratricopeptide (TPR) repeat protein, partial [Kiritimatiellia bacterium]